MSLILFQVASSNKRTAWNLQKCHPPSESGQEVSLIMSQVASSNKRTAWNLSPVSSPQWVWSRGVTNLVSSGKFQQNEQLENPFKGVIPNESGQEMSPINHVASGKFKQTNSLKPFPSVIPSESGQEVSLIMFQVASSNKQTAWNLSKVSSPVWLVQRCHQSNGKVPVSTNEQLVSTLY